MIINQSLNMTSNNLNTMPLEIKDLITSSIKKDIVAMSNIKCTSTSFSHVQHTMPERRFLSQEIIHECVMHFTFARVAGMQTASLNRTVRSTLGNKRQHLYDGSCGCVPFKFGYIK